MPASKLHFSPRPNRAHEIAWREWGEDAFQEAREQTRASSFSANRRLVPLVPRHGRETPCTPIPASRLHQRAISPLSRPTTTSARTPTPATTWAAGRRLLFPSRPRERSSPAPHTSCRSRCWCPARKGSRRTSVSNRDEVSEKADRAGEFHAAVPPTMGAGGLFDPCHLRRSCAAPSTSRPAVRRCSASAQVPAHGLD